jgi:hypothetical protein
MNETSYVDVNDGGFEMYLIGTEMKGYPLRLSFAMSQPSRSRWTSRFVLTDDEVRELWNVLGDALREMNPETEVNPDAALEEL